jgi:hypothetical protein
MTTLLTQVAPGAREDAPRFRPSLASAGRHAGWAPVVGVLVLAAAVRFVGLGAVGFNSDEAVYAGTSASMSGNTGLQGMFPVFRAHPLLFQIMVALFTGGHVTDLTARAVSAAVGVLAVGTTYLLGRRMYGAVAATVSSLVLALMPYHVVVSRQVLLDGLIVPFATLALYCVVRYCDDAEGRWLVSAGAMMGLAMLSKETAVVLFGGLYAFFAATPQARLRWRDVLGAVAIAAAAFGVFPIVVKLSGRGATGSNYLLWQLSRRPNHPWSFYLTTLPGAVGVLTLVVALAGLVLLRRCGSWRESLLIWWIAVPTVFFTLWPVKGYQYLLPVAPALAVLAGRAVAHLATLPWVADRAPRRRVLVAIGATVLAVSLATPTLAVIRPGTSGTFLAGTGGVPGGREAGYWIRDNVPPGAQLLAVGPSMANILQFYGRRRVYGLSVSANPHERNPAYVPVPNPDRWIRDARVQYLVWDSYSAERTPFFTAWLKRLIDRHHAVAVHTATVQVPTSSGGTAPKPVVIVYQVWPS